MLKNTVINKRKLQPFFRNFLNNRSGMIGGLLDKFDRFQLLHRHLRNHRRPIPLTRLAELMECSDKTVHRAIEQIQNYLETPIKYFPAHKGWQYIDWQEQNNNDDLHQLPGLWLTANELQSLALLLQLLTTFGNGLFNDELTVIDRHISKLLKARGIERKTFERHIKVLPHTNRYVPNRHFTLVCEALLQRQQLEIHYSSYQHAQTHRTVSPQTLIYYRENWYLDAWCHLRKALRSFSLARITEIHTKKEQAKEVPPEELQAHFVQGYGIFAGKASHSAKLRFFSTVAREIAMQQWHPDQQGEWDGDDYVLTIPYSDDRELIQDILRHTPNVYVESPVKLRKAVQNRLHAGLEIFSGKRIRRP